MEQGFTIIEMIIVIFIISVALVGIYGAFSIIIILNNGSLDRLQATYLSQEGIEIIRNIRDSNWIYGVYEEGGGWAFGLADGDTDCAQGCQADYTTNPVQSRFLTAWGAQGNFLNITADGLYGYGEGTPTKFKRKITIEPLGEDAFAVGVETMWLEKPSLLRPAGGEESIEVKAIFYDWF